MKESEAHSLGESLRQITWPSVVAATATKTHSTRTICYSYSNPGAVRVWSGGLFCTGTKHGPYLYNVHTRTFSRKTRVWWFSSHPQLWQAGLRSLSKHALVLYYSFSTEPAEKNHIAHGCLFLFSKTCGCISSLYLLLYTHTLFHIIQFKLFGLCWLRYDTLLCYSGECCAGRSWILPRAFWCLFHGEPSVRGFLSMFSAQNSSRKALLLYISLICTSLFI